MQKNKSSKLGLAFSLLGLGLILVFGNSGNINKTSSTFASEPVEITGFVGSDSENKSIPKKLLIPALSIDLEVRKSEIIGGYWEVFEDTAGWGNGSGFPGENGNQVIFAHARRGLFLPLKEIENGTNIYVISEGNENTKSSYEYEVREIKEVFPNQTEVIAPTDDETLTLYTCSGFADTKRLIVIAKRV